MKREAESNLPRDGAQFGEYGEGGVSFRSTHRPNTVPPLKVC